MEFWGVEVKSGESLAVELSEDKVLHLSQASLGEVKKDQNESVCLFVTVEGKKLVLGTLTPGKLPQQLFDLVFDKDFVLTHNSKNGSIYFYGYKADQPFEGPEDEFDDESDSEDEAIPLQAADNGKLEAQPKQEKKAPVAEKANAVKDSNAGKQKVKIVEPSKKDDEDDDSDDDSDDAMSDDDGSDSEGDDSLDDEDDSDDDEDSSSDDEDTPQKVQSGKKRPSVTDTKTPVPDKKAKLVTPQKTDGKKGAAHVSTPHPSKQAAKTPANKSDQKSSPKSGGVSCTSCKKNFKNEGGLSAHNKAKHGAA